MKVLFSTVCVALFETAFAANGVTKPSLRGQLREQWERALSVSTPSMLEDAEVPGATSFEVLFSVGESFPSDGSVSDPYFPPGILDGMGAYKLNEDTVRALVNHELLNADGYAYPVNGGTYTMTGSRVSYFDIDIATRTVVKSGLAYDKVYDNAGNLATNTTFLQNGFSGFSRFCSGRLVEGGKKGFFKKSGSGPVDMIYFAGEEDGGSFNPISGSVWALDVNSGDFWAVPAMGRGAWENVSPVDTGDASTTAFVLADDTSPFDVDADGEDEAAPMYLYVGTKVPGGNFLERNGLAGGKLYVLVLDSGSTLPSQVAQTVPETATWVEIDNSQCVGCPNTDSFGYPTQRNLWTQAESQGSFGFSRPEDVHEDPKNPNVIVLASTGRSSYDNGADAAGTLYTIETDFSDLSATLGILYDGNADPLQRLRSPDNLVWTQQGEICAQEDRAASGLFGAPGTVINPNEAGIVCINTKQDSITRIANIDRSSVVDFSVTPAFGTGTPAQDEAPSDVGRWESSGIIDVSALFDVDDEKLFLVNVQAHGIDDQERFNGDSRIIDEDLKEGGQLILMTYNKD